MPTSATKSKPLVSIGCAVYNGEQTLERALASLTSQDYEHLEILISDDASTDGSAAIYEGFARRDPRIRVHRHAKNVGVTRNFNALVERATGRYFMWGDQDDLREPSFVSRAVAALEAEPEAILCHSHTGVFVGDHRLIKYIITLDGVAGVTPLFLRYWRFLRYYADTVLYGLMRIDALRSTRLYPNALGSANALLFELILRGPFIQIPEVLSYNSGRGIRRRPNSEQEYARMNLGRAMPRVYLPFLVLAKNQLTGIFRARLAMSSKLVLAAVLCSHVIMVAGTKVTYRLAWRVTGGHLPEWLTRLCDDVVESKKHLRFMDGAERDEELFPRAWALKGPSIRNRT